MSDQAQLIEKPVAPVETTGVEAEKPPASDVPDEELALEAQTGGTGPGDKPEAGADTPPTLPVESLTGRNPGALPFDDAPEPVGLHIEQASPPGTPQSTASIGIKSMSGGSVVGAVSVTQGLVPLDQSPVRPPHLSRVLDTYARPAGFDRLVSLIREQTRIVVFDIEENSGRTTHAEALAARLAGLSAAADRQGPERPSSEDTSSWNGTPTTSSDPSDHRASGTAEMAVDLSSVPEARHARAVSFDVRQTQAAAASESDTVSGQNELFDVARLMFGGSEYFPDKRLPTDQLRVWLLELPADDEEGFRVHDTFGDCLPDLDRMLAAQNSRLIVLTRPDQWRRIGAKPSPRWPSAREVLPDAVESTVLARAQLIGRKPDIDVKGWLEDPDIAGMFEQGGNANAMEVVADILAAEQTPVGLLPADPKAGSAEGALDDQVLLARRIAMVVDSRGKWRRQLLEWHRQSSRTAFERDFQVAAATLTGLPVTHVYHGANQLNTKLGGKGVVDAAGQHAPGVIAMLDAIGGEVVAGDLIQFPRPGWADSILEYFWADRPLARTTFLEWLAGAPASSAGESLESVSNEQRRAAARRITRFALGWAARHNREMPLAKLAEAWHDTHPALWQDLVEVLDAVACAPSADPTEVGADIAPLVVHQRYVHRLLLDWAKSSAIERVHAVLRVCAGPFAVRYTGKALVRLKYAGRHGDERVKPALGDVIDRLWQESSARSTLIAEIADWCDNAAVSRVAGSHAFARLATATVEGSPDSAGGHAVALLRESGDYVPDYRLLARCWRAHLAIAPQAESAALVALWLGAAIDHPVQRHAVIDILRLAVSGTTVEDRTTRDIVRGIALTWSADRPDRKELYHDLTGALDKDITHTMQALLADEGRS
ncbi:hypothetical protein [Amycolatopsis sp. cmx-11-12]|uniref:hypothetical protein n=1 Tax=Amycolatopsis sp. cmx-11-12 TaxID=2785795 RepID=UPI0039183A89